MVCVLCCPSRSGCRAMSDVPPQAVHRCKRIDFGLTKCDGISQAKGYCSGQMSLQDSFRGAAHLPNVVASKASSALQSSLELGIVQLEGGVVLCKLGVAPAITSISRLYSPKPSLCPEQSTVGYQVVSDVMWSEQAHPKTSPWSHNGQGGKSLYTLSHLPRLLPWRSKLLLVYGTVVQSVVGLILP